MGKMLDIIAVAVGPKKADALDVGEAIHAVGVVKELEKEIVRMEEKARKYYESADELSDAGNRTKSIQMREIGNAIYEDMTTLKQIVYRV